MLDRNLKLQPEDAWILGILVTALQREVEVPGHVPGSSLCDDGSPSSLSLFKTQKLEIVSVIKVS